MKELGIDKYEQEQLKSLAEGSQSSFNFIYKKYQSFIFLNALKLVKEELYAREIMQEVFLKIWTNREQIDPEKHFPAYLFKIMQNSIFDFFRRASKSKIIQESLIHHTSEHANLRNPIEDQIYFKETEKELQIAIQSLPPQCRKVFILCKLEGKTHEEVSNMLNISTATVNNHIVKGSRLLKDSMIVKG